MSAFLATYQVSNLDQQTALAVLRKYRHIVSRSVFVDAARLMKKQLNSETLERLELLDGCKFCDCPPLVLDFLETLGMDILKAA